MDERAREDTAFFFDQQPQAFPLYLCLERALLERYADMSVKVQKTQISFVAKHLFACVSLPRKKSDQGAIVVTFGLSRRVCSPRIAVVVQPYPDRWTHHVLVWNAGEIDAELLGWIAEAYEFAKRK